MKPGCWDLPHPKKIVMRIAVANPGQRAAVSGYGILLDAVIRRWQNQGFEAVAILGDIN
jgi:hypothetical protein